MKTLKQKYDKTVKAYLDAFCTKNGAEIVEAPPYLSHIKIRPVFFSCSYGDDDTSLPIIFPITLDDIRYDVDCNMPAGAYVKWYANVMTTGVFPVVPYQDYCKSLDL